MQQDIMRDHKRQPLRQGRTQDSRHGTVQTQQDHSLPPTLEFVPTVRHYNGKEQGWIIMYELAHKGDSDGG